MRINKIVIKNFNSFEGYNELDFSSSSKKKNIILIGGKNGAGKTSLFNAIKIALYGPLSFGYVGINPHYISKIKDYINTRAFQMSDVSSMVQISITMIIDREVKDYVITREWNYTGKKFEEFYSILEDGQKLNENEISYFENYLLGQIPPDLFEFFFFDGEEVGSIFATSAYSKYIRNAIYKLNGLDTYEHIRRISSGYAGADLIDGDINSEYESIKEQLEAKATERNELEDALSINQQELDNIDVELAELQTMFQKAGGITTKEKKALSNEYAKNEQVKAEASAEIKSFVEGIMPFYIARDYSSLIEKQIDFEEKVEISNIVRNNLNKEDIIKRIKHPKSEQVVSEVVNAIYEMFSVDNEQDVIYNLSKDEIRLVSSVIGNVNSFDREGMINTIEKRRVAFARNMEINSILKSSLSDDDSSSYVNKENELLRKKGELQQLVFDQQNDLETIEAEIMTLDHKKTSIESTIKSDLQARRVSDLSSSMERLMRTLLDSKTVLIRKNLESEIVNKLKCILRKDNLITHIEINSDFSFNLYQNASYETKELVNLIDNVGIDEFLLNIGQEGVQKLKTVYSVESVPDVEACLRRNRNKSIDLYKRIDLDKLSKGERQVFILSFYWSVIELSGKEIPFIIDTPYARIDAGHRKGISKYFFPSISDQVIILSTDEEISEEYYKIIKPYVCKEYLLVNDKNQNHTTITKGYFFG